MLFTVTFLHNVTRVGGRLAVLARFTENRLLPGDTLMVVGVLLVPASTVTDAAEAAYAIGNGADPACLVEVYRSWGVRSLCSGDSLIIQAPGERRHLLACTTTGWQSVRDPRAYTILPGHPPTTSSSPDCTGSTGSPDAVPIDTPAEVDTEVDAEGGEWS